MRQPCCHARKGAGGIKMCNLAPVSTQSLSGPHHLHSRRVRHVMPLVLPDGLGGREDTPSCHPLRGGREERT